MAVSNRERVGKVLDLLRDGLAPFVKREMESCYGDSWPQEAIKSLSRESDWSERGDELRDVHALLLIMWGQWNEVFRQVLGYAERSLVSELREVRNLWAHQNAFTSDDTYRALDSAHRLLTAISAPEARDVDRMKQELLRIRYEEQARRESRKASVVPIEGKPSAGLRPWRQIVTPHPDVASGRYQQAEFAADLGQVHRGEGSSEYRDPREFFSRTYITDGLKGLLTNGATRLSGKGGDPIVELQTNFGGGKTHSMLALYHLFSDVPASELPGAGEVLADAEIKCPTGVRRAVLVGTALSPAQPLRLIGGGRPVNTLWGEMAYQIGGEEGFELVAQADAQGVSPGSEALRVLFSKFGPCLVLIDEWVAFVRQLYHKGDQRAGSFEANMTFAQALTEAARQVHNTLVVASIPASDIETGGEGGREALHRIRNTFGRMESSWRPATAEEGFEIVRRRLFEPITDPQKFAARDAVVAAFGNAYREQSQEFPTHCREASYERRMRDAYPIHPELFDRLYGAWSSLDKFQRTRGVLRLMATVIHGLWERGDGNLLIMPGTVPIDDPAVNHELNRYLDDNWQPIIEKDVDGPHSLPLSLDRDNPNLGRYSASRRVSRTIYMGSAPTSTTPNPGIDERSVRLGCVQPGENPAIFGDALRRLTDQATYLYADKNRYWFSTQPNMIRLAHDRADNLKTDDVWDELKRRIRTDRSRGDFAGVHPVPDDGSQVVDEMSARLVILGPEYSHANKDWSSPALKQAQSILSNRGSGPRFYQNMLVFLVPDRARLVDLGQSIRMYLAWDSIVKDATGYLDLNPSQKGQAETKLQEADSVVRTRINETYVWILHPVQPEATGDIEWQEIRLQSGEGPLAARTSKRILGDYLITMYSATSLRIELDRFLWKDKPHLGLRDLWTYLASYAYLPRLRDENVLLAAIQDGISEITWTDNFAYAEAYDAEKDRYLGLKAGRVSSVMMDGRSVLVKPDVALRQMREDSERQQGGEGVPGGERKSGGRGPGFGPEGRTGATGGAGSGGEPPVGEEPKLQQVRRFYGSVALDPIRLQRDASTVANEVLQHFTSLVGTEVEVSLEISVRSEAGIPDNVVRTVSENCRTLKFKTGEFEKE